MRLCCDCKWYRGRTGRTRYQRERCGHPKLLKREPVFGRLVYRYDDPLYNDPNILRMPGGGCEPKAKWFEPRGTFWERLKAIIYDTEYDGHYIP